MILVFNKLSRTAKVVSAQCTLDASAGTALGDSHEADADSVQFERIQDPFTTAKVRDKSCTEVALTDIS